MTPAISHTERGYLREFFEYVEPHLRAGDASAGLQLIPPIAAPDVDATAIQGLVRSALVDASWGPLLELCQSEGRRFSEEGVPLAAWYGWTREFRAEVLRTLALAPVEDRRLSWRILEGLTLYQSFVVEAVANGYLRSRD